MLSLKTENHVVDAEALRRSLGVLIEEAGTQLAFAKALGFCVQYLHDVVNDRRDIGALAGLLGYSALTLYVTNDGETILSDLAARVIEKIRVTLDAGGAA